MQLAAPSVVMAPKPWTTHDTRLAVVTLLGTAIIVALIVAAKMHPFLSLIFGSAFVGFAAGVGSGGDDYRIRNHEYPSVWRSGLDSSTG